MKGIDFLRAKLETKQTRVLRRYRFYEMKNVVQDFRIATPPSLEHWQSCIGWCAKAVDSLADRLVFKGFDADNFEVWDIFCMNNADVFFDSAVLEALIASCSFVYLAKGDDGFPFMQVITALDATGIIDTRTGLLEEGYAVLDRDDHGFPSVEAHFLPGETVVYRRGERSPQRFSYHCDFPLLVPIINRPDAKRPFGHSRISRSCMNLVESAVRTIKRSEIAAEFYSFPQKYINGLSDGAEVEKWKAAMSAVLTITKDDDGDHPQIGQFQQQSMAPHVEQFKMFAAQFAGETGLTLDDMGFASGNPASAEAIKAAHDNLRLTARKAQRTFGTGFLNVGFLAACLRDDFAYERRQFYLTSPVWEPIFEPDALMLSSIGDGAIKINQAVPGYFGSDNLATLTGIDASASPAVVPEPVSE